MGNVLAVRVGDVANGELGHVNDSTDHHRLDENHRPDGHAHLGHFYPVRPLSFCIQGSQLIFQQRS